MKNRKKPRVTRQELDDLGLEALDTAHARESKSPAYRRNRRKKELLTVLRATLGNVSGACEKVGVSRATFYLWRQEDTEFDQAVREINERTLDFVEQSMMSEIKKGNAKLIIFYLMNRGRERGYCRKPEDVQQRPQVNIVLSDDEFKY